MSVIGNSRLPLAALVKRESRRVATQIASLWNERSWIRHQIRLRHAWWTRPRFAYEPFFIVATARSGTNLLVDCLNQLPGVVCQSEVLNWGMAIGPRRRIGPREAMQHIGYSLNALGGPRRGCKLFFNHLKHYRLSLDELAGAFPGCKFVILYRQSLAEQFVSLLVAKGTKQWMVRQGQASALAQVHVVVDEFKSYCDQMRLSYGEILALPWLASRTALLSYEELSFDPKACLARHICPLLAVSPTEMAPRIRKQNTLPLAERVVNYNEVAELLASPIARQRYSCPQRQAA